MQAKERYANSFPPLYTFFSGCDTIGLLGGLSGTVSIVTMAAIAVERFFGIKNCWKMGSRVIWPSVKIPTWKRVLSLAFFWIYGLTFSIVPLIPGSGLFYVPEGFLTTCSFDYLDTSEGNQVHISS
jgi:r-opsin